MPPNGGFTFPTAKSATMRRLTLIAIGPKTLPEQRRLPFAAAGRRLEKLVADGKVRKVTSADIERFKKNGVINLDNGKFVWRRSDYDEFSVMKTTY